MGFPCFFKIRVTSRTFIKSWIKTVTAGMLLMSLGQGCGTLDYSLSALKGEAALLQAAVPIETAINDPSLSDEQREKLAFVVRARDYASEVVGLNVGDAYQTFVDLKGGSLSWNLSGSRMDRFEPFVWNLPIVGALPYLGFFDFEQAQAERDRLLSLGYDTVLYEVDAYSTLGLLPDPVVSTLLRRDFPSLADTIMHESLHNTIYRTGDTNFNESMATFVGRTAGVEFLEQEFGANSPVVQQARDFNEDSDRLNIFLQQVKARLDVIYDSDRTTEEKLAAREEIFQSERDRFASEIQPLMHFPNAFKIFATSELNNAFLLLNLRYNTDLKVFADVYELTGHDWGQTLNLFSQAAASDDPVEFLRALAAGSP